MIITGKKFSKPDMSRVINGDVILDTGPEKPERFRLDHLLVEKHPEYNRSSLQSFIKSGYVTVDGKEVRKPNTLIEKSQEIGLNLPPEMTDNDLKQRLIDEARPKTVYEDKNVMVLYKPAGLLSMAKGEYATEPTLEDYGLLVHRLDRDTSGVVILAKNEPTQKLLRKQFQDRKAHKVYYAVVEGHPKLDAARVDLPIMRSLKHPTTFIVDPAGKASETFYKVVKKGEKRSLVQLKPTTGRTHQLRVHMQYLGTPILGDRVYGTAPADTKERLYLHASMLEITIPDPEVEYTGETGGKVRRTFEVPVPAEFADVL